MTETARRYRIRRERVPRLLFALSARSGGSPRREERTIELFERQGHGAERRVLWVRSAPAGREIGVLDAGDPTGLAANDAAGVLAVAGYTSVASARVEAEVYRAGEVTVAVDHLEPVGWFCAMSGPDEAAEQLAAALDLTPGDRESRDEVALVADRLPPRPAVAGPSRAWPSALAGSAATLGLVLVAGANLTLVALLAVLAALGLAWLVRSALADRPDSGRSRGSGPSP